jgi:hypothetical protein
MQNKKPPKRKIGQGRGERAINGELLDVKGAARLYGISPSALRCKVWRRTVPFRKWNGRVVFLRKELERFLMKLPGCTLEEAVKHGMTLPPPPEPPQPA